MAVELPTSPGLRRGVLEGNKKFSATDVVIASSQESEWKANPEYDDLVKETWKQKQSLAKEDGVNIWDGTYYRVANLAQIEESGKLSFELGTVPYRYIATAQDLNNSFIANKFEPFNHLSTATMIRTSDGRYIFGKRSRNGQLDVIGGGAQKDEMEIEKGIDLERNLRKEMFEETGIQDSQIESLQGIGIVQSITTNIIFMSLVQLTVSQYQMTSIFKHRLEDEMSDLVYVPETEIETFLKQMPSYRPLIAELL